MKTHEQFVRENPDRVRQQLAEMIAERDKWLDKQRRARSEQGKRNCDGSIRWAEKMIRRYEADLRLLDEPAPATPEKEPTQLTRRQASELLDRVHDKRGKRYDEIRAYAHKALMALSVTLALTLSTAGAQTMSGPTPDLAACYRIQDSGEGFPQVYCPLTGHAYYRDMDGVDGALGTEGDGDWKVLP